MSTYYEIRRDQTLREAEGYLELSMVGDDKWELNLQLRDRLGLRALERLMRLDEHDEHWPYILYLRGQSLRMMERYDEAIIPLRESALLKPRNLHAWLALGWCHKRTNRLDLAIESLEEALDADPEEAIVHYNLACYWSLAGNAQLALGYLRNSFEIDSSYRDLVDDEKDFDPIRAHPNFQKLTAVVV